MLTPTLGFSHSAQIRQLKGGVLSAPQTTSCRLELRHELRTNAQDGSEALIVCGRGFLPAGVRLPPGSELWVSGACCRVVRQQVHESPFGEHYVEVEFG